MKIYRNPDVLWREEEEASREALAVMERGDDVEEMGTSLLFADGVMVTLNLLGTEIWKMCDGISSEELIAALLAQFEVEEDVLREDVQLFLDDLAAKGFIRYE